MLLRVNGQYLTLHKGQSPVIEKRWKLFESIDSTMGDLSYEISLPRTAHNLALLGHPLPNVSNKIIYRQLPCDVLDNDAIELYKGILRVDNLKQKTIECTFFGGNCNWFNLLTGNITDMDFSEYDTEIEYIAIFSTWANTEGITFPFIDAGALITRSNKNTKLEDWPAGMYAKTIFKKIFNSIGVKIKGDLMNDWVYNNLILCKNNKNKTDINDRSCYVEKTSSQILPTVPPNSSILVTWDNDSSFPFFDGAQNCFSLVNERYTADVGVRVKVDFSFTFYLDGGGDKVFISLRKNGVSQKIYTINSDGPGSTKTFTSSAIVRLNAAAYIDFHASADSLSTNCSLTNGTVKITPTFVYNVKGVSTIPNWTKIQYVTNILNLFNVITDYNPVSKEITFNLFEKLKTRGGIDISQYIQVDDVDYTSFVSGFGKKSKFKYEDGETEELKQYNVTQYLKYGEGIIQVDNEYIQDEADIITSNFKTPISYINGVFDCSLERINLLTVSPDSNVETEFTSVTDSAGVARFAVADDVFILKDLVRVTQSTDPVYNGDWVVTGQGAGYVELDFIGFGTNATGKITKLEFEYSDTEDVFIFINIPSYNLSNFSSIGTLIFETNSNTSPAYAYFNLLNTGRTVNTDFKQSLSFGPVNDPLFYQKTILDTYWPSVDNVLNDPVKLICAAHFPKSVFLSLKAIDPVYLITEEASGLFYINNIVGYEGSHIPCEINLIKI